MSQLSRLHWPRQNLCRQIKILGTNILLGQKFSNRFCELITLLTQYSFDLNFFCPKSVGSQHGSKILPKNFEQKCFSTKKYFLMSKLFGTKRILLHPKIVSDKIFIGAKFFNFHIQCHFFFGSKFIFTKTLIDFDTKFSFIQILLEQKLF